jgi:peroxiredoxin
MIMPNAMRLLFLVLSILTGLFSFAQKVVKLSGKIEHPLSDSVMISYNDGMIAYFPKEYYAPVDKNGKFSISFPVPAEVFFQAVIAELVLHSGDSLCLTADAAHFDSSVRFIGRGSEVANFVSRHTFERGRMNRYSVKVKAAISKLQGDFLKEIATERFAEESYLNLHKTGLPVSFVKYWNACFRYCNYFFTEQYPQVHEMVKYRKYTDSIPPENFRVLVELPYAFDDDLLQVPSYLLYLTGIFEIKLKAAGFSASWSEPVKALQVEDSVFRLAYTLLPPRSAELYVAQNLYTNARLRDVVRTDSLYAIFKNHWPVSEYRPVVEKQIAIAKSLSKGQPAPDFGIVTPEGKKMKLSDLRGKVVYLGFWAGGCKQCVGEMINEKRIKPQLKDKPVEFVYVSLDADTATSGMMASKFNIDGIFTHADGGWNAKEVQLYGVQGLPAYYLIDQQGNFAVQHTPAPGDPSQLVLEIGKLFK